MANQYGNSCIFGVSWLCTLTDSIVIMMLTPHLLHALF